MKQLASAIAIGGENILPTRGSRIFGALFAALALINLAFAAYQLAFAYFSGEGLDVDEVGFMAAASVFLLATYAASYQLRKLSRRLVLMHGLRRRIVIAEYDPPCSPGVAGALLDGEFDMAEVKAMMIDLALRGYLACNRTPNGEIWTYPDASYTNLPGSEVALLKALFADGRELHLPTMKPRLRAAASAIHAAVLDEGRATGLIKPPKAGSINRQSIQSTMLILGYIVIALMFYALIADFQSITTISYPRYPVHLWQLLFILGQIVVIVGVAGDAYIRSSLTARGLDLSTSVAGFYLFIRTVFENPERYGSRTDLAKYYPYAVAFRLPVKFTPSSGQNWRVLLGL